MNLKKLLYIILIVSPSLYAQTFPVNNLTAAGTITSTGAVTTPNLILGTTSLSSSGGAGTIGYTAPDGSPSATSVANRLFYLDGVSQPTTGTDGAPLASINSLRDTTSVSGGSLGYVNPSIWHRSIAGASNISDEWGIVDIVDNYATTGPQNVGIYGQGNKRSTGATWAATFEAQDFTGVANPISGLVGLESDTFGNGTDGNNVRVGVDVSIGKSNQSGAIMETAYGVCVGALNSDITQGRVKSAFKVGTIGFDAAFDSSQGTQSSGGVAFKMAVGQSLSFSQTNDRTMQYTGGALHYQVSGTDMFTINDSGNLSALGGFNSIGISNFTDTGRSGNSNAASINISNSEALNYTASYVTHYGMLLNNTELTGGTGDRIGLSSIQTCQATLAGKSCVADAPLVVSAGTNLGGYTASNPKVLIPSSLPNSASIAAGQEIDIETHSLVNIRNGLRIADENLSGGTITHGSVEDSAITIVTDTTTGNPGFNVGIQFGENTQGYPQYWPILAGGTLLQASNPSIVLNYGLDLSGSTAGFNNQAISLPQNSNKNGIMWGISNLAGSINSSATTTGNHLTFSNNGILVNNTSGGTQLILGESNNIAYQISPIPIASLPTCTSGLQGAVSYINDTTALTTPTWHSNVQAGGSTSVQSMVSCNGVNWQYN